MNIYEITAKTLLRNPLSMIFTLSSFSTYFCSFAKHACNALLTQDN